MTTSEQIAEHLARLAMLVDATSRTRPAERAAVAWALATLAAALPAESAKAKLVIEHERSKNLRRRSIE